MKQIPLYEQIYEEIREKIEERGYRVGDRLPSEKELSEQYHVSRITSKKAVELLAEEGLVTRIPGKGTFVIEHQEMPKALEIPADSMTEKKPLPDHPPVIGVVLDGFGADFGCQMLGSIEMECRNQGFGMMFVCSYGRKDEETTGIERLRELGVSGIIIMCVHDENYSESILEMAVQHFPVVTIDRRLKGVPISFVGTDNEAASRELARYLLDRGYRKTCFVKPHAAETSTLQERIQGFKRHIMNMVCLQMKACGLRISARRFRRTISTGENSSLQKTRKRSSNLSKNIRRLIPTLQWNTVWRGLSIPV
ncbi:MAG: GntR family transcriptional regulator [Gallintestinimicrobium sp.]